MTQTEIEEYITQFPIYQYAFVKPEAPATEPPGPARRR